MSRYWVLCQWFDSFGWYLQQKKTEKLRAVFGSLTVQLDTRTSEKILAWKHYDVWPETYIFMFSESNLASVTLHWFLWGFFSYNVCSCSWDFALGFLVVFWLFGFGLVLVFWPDSIAFKCSFLKKKYFSKCKEITLWFSNCVHLFSPFRLWGRLAGPQFLNMINL